MVPDTVQLMVEVAGLCSWAVLAQLLLLHVGERAGDTLVGVVHAAVDRRAVLGGQAVLLVPDVEGRFLVRDAAGIPRLNLHGSAHCDDAAPVSSAYATDGKVPLLRSRPGHSRQEPQMPDWP